MVTTLIEREQGRVLEVAVSGKLSHEDYQSFVPVFERSTQRHGQVRVLFAMSDFHGWNAGGLWDDVKFDMKHFAHIERLAMVGERKWEHAMSVFCRPFTAASIRYFDSADIGAARAWLDS